MRVLLREVMVLVLFVSSGDNAGSMLRSGVGGKSGEVRGEDGAQEPQSL